MKIEQVFYNELHSSSSAISTPIIKSVEDSYNNAIREVQNRHKVLVAAYHNTAILCQLIPNHVERESFLIHVSNMFEKYKTLKSAPNMQNNMSNFFERLSEGQAPF